MEIGVGLSSLRLAKPLPPEPVTGGAGDGDTTSADGAATGGAETSGTSPGGQDGGSTAAPERQVTFALRTSLSSDAPKDALYALLHELADRVDDGSASYAEVMVKIRITSEAADSIADLIRGTGSNPDVREV